MPNVGTAYLQIMPSAKGMGSALSQQMTSEGGVAGNIFGGSLASAAIKAISAAGIGVAIKKAIGEAGELQQNLGGSEAVFGDYADTIKELATDAYKTMGLSASEYMATANKMGSLFQGSGLEQQRALELTTEAMQRASDVASVMGISQQMAMESVAGAAKGNFTMMDNLGVTMNATTLQAYALEKGVNFKWDTASNAERAELAMQMFMERTKQYAGNFAKESETTYTGSLGAMQAVTKNFMANLALGMDIKEPLRALVETTKTYVSGNLIPMIKNIFKGVGGLIIDSIKDGLTNLPSMVESAKTFINNLADAIQNNGGEALEKIKSAALEIGRLFIEAIKGTDWAGLGQSILKLIATGLEVAGSFLWDAFKSLGEIIKQKFGGEEADWPGVARTILTAIGDAIGSLGSLIVEAFMNLATSAKEKFAGVNWAEAGANAFHLLVEGLKKVGSALWEGLKLIGETAAEHFKGINWRELGSTVLELIKNGLVAVGSFLWEALKSIGETAWTKLKEIEWTELGKTVIKFIWEGLGAIGSWIWDKLKLIGEAAVEKYKEIDWVQLGKDVIKFIWNGLGEIGSWIWEKLKLLGEAAVEKFKEIDWLQLGKDVINFIVDGLKEIGDTLWEKLKGIGETAVEKFKEIDWKQLGKDVINALWEGIKSVGGWVVDGISWLAEKGAGLFSGDDYESSVDWYDTGYGVPEDIANGISNNGWRTSNALQSVTTDAWNAANTGYDWFGMGTSIVGGIANGIWYYGASIYNALYSQVSSAWQNAKWALGIYSPSKVMRDEIGKWIPLGIAEGIESETPAVMDAMAGITKDLTTSIDTGFAYNATLDTGDGGAETAPGGIVINVYPSAGMDERALADMVEQRLAFAQRQRQTAWGMA